MRTKSIPQFYLDYRLRLCGEIKVNIEVLDHSAAITLVAAVLSYEGGVNPSAAHLLLFSVVQPAEYRLCFLISLATALAIVPFV